MAVRLQQCVQQLVDDRTSVQPTVIAALQRNRKSLRVPQPAVQHQTSALDHIFVSDDVGRGQVSGIVPEEPVQDDDLAPQQVGLPIQRTVQRRVQLLAGRNAAPAHRQVHGLPRRQDRQRVADQGQTRERFDQMRQERRKQRIVLDQQGKAGGERLVDRDFAPLGPEPPQAGIGVAGRAAVVVESALDLDGGRPALGQEPRPRLLGKLTDTQAGAARSLHPADRLAANGLRQGHRVRQLAREPAAQRGPGAWNSAQQPGSRHCRTHRARSHVIVT